MSMGLDSLLLLRKKGTYYYAYLIFLASPLKYSVTLSTSLTLTLLLDRYHASPVIFWLISISYTSNQFVCLFS